MIPALDNHSLTQGESERISSVNRRVKLGAVLQGASVVNQDGITDTCLALAFLRAELKHAKNEKQAAKTQRHYRGLSKGNRECC